MTAETDLFSVTLDDFEDFDMERPPFLFAGVYVFMDKKKVVYVGQSASVPTRIKAHKKKTWFTDKLTVKMYQVNDVSERLILETVTILRLKPSSNKAIKLGLTKAGKVYGLGFLK